jgi:CheY-like chemotaxis protein
MGGLEALTQLRQWEKEQAATATNNCSSSSSSSSPRQQQHQRRQFIIVVTANCTAKHQQEAAQCGADGFCSKPLNMAALVVAIEERRLFSQQQ